MNMETEIILQSCFCMVRRLLVPSAGQYGFAEEYHLIVPHLYGAGKSAGKVYEPEGMKREVLSLVDSLHKDKNRCHRPFPWRSACCYAGVRASGTVLLRSIFECMGEPGAENR